MRKFVKQSYTGATQNWNSLSVSADGKYIYRSAYNGYLYISKDYGRTFTQKTSFGSFNSIGGDNCCSADGKIVLIGKEGNYWYISKDYGETFSSIGIGAGTVCSLTPDGKNIIIGSNGWNNTSYLNISRDYGNTWTQLTSLGNKNWYGASFSESGMYIGICTLGYTGDWGIWVSNDNGNNWSRNETSKGYNGIKVSQLGNVMVATHELGGGTSSDGYTYISTNYGVNWTRLVNAPTINPARILLDKTGTKIVLLDQDSSPYYMWMSENGGNSFYQVETFDSGGLKIVDYNNFYNFFIHRYNYPSGSSTFWILKAPIPAKPNIFKRIASPFKSNNIPLLRRRLL